MKAKRNVLKNGVRVVLVPMPESQTVTTMVLTGVGSSVEKEGEYGLAHFLEHMMFKGTPTRSNGLQIAREIEELGARTNAFTSKNYTGYYATGHCKHARKLLEIISDVYLNPIFPEEEIEKEKGVVTEEINMYEDSPQDLADARFDQMMWGNMTFAGRPILGTRESVQALTRDSLRKFHTKHYCGKNTVVVVAGAFDEKELRSDIQMLFKDLAPGSTTSSKTAKPTAKHKDRHTKDSEQAHVVLGVPGLSRAHKDYLIQSMVVSILSAGMSSRLFSKLREEMGVCYYVYASANVYPKYGSITFHAGVAAHRVEEVLTALRDEMDLIVEALVPADELQKTKNYVLGSFVLGLESSRSYAQYYAMQELAQMDLKTPQARMKEIKAISAGDVQRVAKKLFSKAPQYTFVVGPDKAKG